MVAYRGADATITALNPGGIEPGDVVTVIGVMGGAPSGAFRVTHASDAPWWRNALAWWRWVALPAVRNWNPCS